MAHHLRRVISLTGFTILSLALLFITSLQAQGT
jgi:hypothetical protein